MLNVHTVAKLKNKKELYKVQTNILVQTNISMEMEEPLLKYSKEVEDLI